MARPRKDITGKRYGMLRAISPTGEVDKSGNAYWNCKCDCGNTIVVSLRNLRNKQTKSCGCLKTINGKKLGTITRNHCVDGSDPYKLYGDKPRKNNKSGYRGVSLNKRTNRYAADITFKGKRHHLGEFDTAEEAHNAYLKAKEELHEPYLKDFLHSNPEEKNNVERIGVIKKPRGTLVYYTPENRYISIPELSEITGVSRVKLYSRLNKGYAGEELWSTKRSTGKGTTRVDYYGKQVTMAELSTLTGINRSTLSMRYKIGYRGESLWCIDKLPKTDASKIHIDYNNKQVTFAELSTLTGINEGTLRNRYYNGCQGEELWSTKRLPNKRSPKIYIDYHGKQVTFAELSTLTGINEYTLRQRYYCGYRGEELWSTKRLTGKGKGTICVDYYGDQVTIPELSSITGINDTTLRYRYDKGYRGEELWTGKIKQYKRKISKKAKIYVEYDGEKVSLYELSKKTGIDYGTLWNRYSKGASGSQLFQKSMGNEILVDYEGEKINLKELSSRTGICYTTLHRRYRNGDRGKELWRNPQSEMEIDYQGKKVTLNELSKITNISYDTLLHRHSNGDRGEDLWRPIYKRSKKK
ncbi:AP2 domain-containing protein [[Clostridium] innocuum]|uniref:AP2 domain-containing protein n=1 Tax=Clostridium innocuum TaxID=1522 RepID=UPI000E4F5132|nr:AP2 domain-containing protein [[Clostridium] innocuum]RGT62334.1 AP2 domain-containing protein [[Clostridium] innocuum]